ncbi:prepilin-type N-terminal cleavage/methylation domain-containing protein [Pacificimonas sp. WHA3]|uniref:Prepilin-type N-terminal cleavage/methylation domain-containing protein n=1 Tax=Pacificimonas pallii TaxID=2827236 RepID=A0ABS6SHA8_9SPHN|nr:GspH/FimT family pseudopilin [Pacificimonas pallii]MBV7257813.1 prepilin-type N-terminal cleavage/methylation domain-containing protein [Pacificimonas pallii]
MPLSARQTGFTLVELMVVLAIVGVASAAVVMTIPGDEVRAREEAERLGSRLIAARDRALFSGRDTAAVMSAEGYRFEERVNGAWRQIQEKPLAPASWESGVGVGLAQGEVERVRFDAVGLSEGTALALTGGAERYIVNISTAGDVTIDARR